jgi:hypothetical protein
MRGDLVRADLVDHEHVEPAIVEPLPRVREHARVCKATNRGEGGSILSSPCSNGIDR